MAQEGGEGSGGGAGGGGPSFSSFWKKSVVEKLGAPGKNREIVFLPPAEVESEFFFSYFWNERGRFEG